MAKEERAKLLDDLTSARFHLGEERGRNDTIEKAVESKVVKKNEAVVTELRNTVGRYENELRQQKQKMEVAETENKRKMESLKSKMESINSRWLCFHLYFLYFFHFKLQILEEETRLRDWRIHKRYSNFKKAITNIGETNSKVWTGRRQRTKSAKYG